MYDHINPHRIVHGLIYNKFLWTNLIYLSVLKLYINNSKIKIILNKVLK
jgi:hypothetical protein